MAVPKVKNKHKNKSYNEAREDGLLSVKIGMATQLVAFQDVTGCDIDVLEKVMELAIQYQNNLLKHYNHISDITEALYKQSGIDITIDPKGKRLVLPQQYEYVLRQLDKLREEKARLNRELREVRNETNSI